MTCMAVMPSGNIRTCEFIASYMCTAIGVESGAGVASGCSVYFLQRTNQVACLAEYRYRRFMVAVREAHWS